MKLLKLTSLVSSTTKVCLTRLTTAEEARRTSEFHEKLKNDEQAIRFHPVEDIGAYLRESLQAMKAISVGEGELASA
jgi:hypothetical protein